MKRFPPAMIGRRPTSRVETPQGTHASASGEQTRPRVQDEPSHAPVGSRANSEVMSDGPPCAPKDLRRLQRGLT
jgi:hypothetical protein